MAGWSTPPTAFITQIEGDMTKQMRIIAMALLGEIISRSPVDTGRFRGNTTVTIGSPVFSNSQTLDPTGSTSISKGASVLGGLKPFSIIYIQNNLPYAEKLENGHSKQAPSGVFGLAFAGVAAAYAS
ncbi:HK97 gp10 family phage protein [Pseudomonas syringae pv. actinidifoliorum]|uniref:HK97 gp10 family phage protein n=1 Tax=Pseudomonas syringae TaxID=317 RepID=UPI001F3DCBEC|nr:HK97 gp10 family phage protein [Pseudomonas syringae]MDU8429183.1 HK97 gp10 family phage protein [Pseudomonas syringae pv. actinidifoliorum]MBL3827616.1 HK97 gp10 family phage protein [Pseudomonas syringae pv. theae]MBL3836816.1 HK97 gp10 family phage protein [Pseudomonas syringae pv. theae]MBL3866860.1 HK97 gp10 family phage protein [Pseudomonas syringae pv. theae]MDU8520054.1 HK97 gp10 family phage protein [Pseudomonas syringae pv. actinidifoliorum]